MPAELQVLAPVLYKQLAPVDGATAELLLLTQPVDIVPEPTEPPDQLPATCSAFLAIVIHSLLVIRWPPAAVQAVMDAVWLIRAQGVPPVLDVATLYGAEQPLEPTSSPAAHLASYCITQKSLVPKVALPGTKIYPAGQVATATVPLCPPMLLSTTLAPVPSSIGHQPTKPFSMVPRTSSIATGLAVPIPTLPYWSTINILAPVVEATLKELTPAVPTMANLEAGVDVPMPTVAVPVLAINKGVRVGVVEVPT